MEEPIRYEDDEDNEQIGRTKRVSSEKKKALARERGIKEYNINQFQDKIRSKGDMYQVLTTGSKCYSLIIYLLNLVQYYLPDFKNCPIKFMRDIFGGYKKVITYKLM